MLRRQHRLRKRGAFRRLFAEGHSWAEPAAVLHTLPQLAAEKRIAVSASRKLGNAVQRNRIRRRFAAICRQFEPCIRTGVHLVFVPRAAAAATTPGELADVIERLLRRAGAWAEAPTDACEPYQWPANSGRRRQPASRPSPGRRKETPPAEPAR